VCLPIVCIGEKIGHKLVINLQDLVLEEGMDVTKDDLGALFYRNQKFVDQVHFDDTHEVTFQLRGVLPEEVIRVVIERKEDEEHEVIHTISFPLTKFLEEGAMELGKSYH